jgi:histidinol-phosphate/aromatic aminotransferase/cobyric acid decarboxylase-like protein
MVLSMCDFLFIDVKTDAVQLAEGLLQRGVIVKPWKPVRL